MTFSEGFLQFEFGATWRIVKYDEHAQHVERLQTIESQAIDFLAARTGTVLLLEVKDFRGRRIENKGKLGGALAITVAQKMRDSVSGIVGQRRLDAPTATQPWADCGKAMIGSGDVLAVLFLQTDRHPAERRKVLLSTQLKLLKQRMQWSGMRVLVVDLDTYNTAIADLTVKSLPGAGGSP